MANNMFMATASPDQIPIPRSNPLVSQITQVESGGRSDAKNPRSSATGSGQFINKTWLSMIQKYRPELMEGRSKAEILELRKNKQLSDEMTDLYAKENQKALTDAGLPVTPGTTYLAHFAGPAGAKALLQNPNAEAAAVMAAAGGTTPDKILQANPFLAGMTGAEVAGWADKKMGKATKKGWEQQAKEAIARHTPLVIDKQVEPSAEEKDLWTNASSETTGSIPQGAAGQQLLSYSQQEPTQNQKPVQLAAATNIPTASLTDASDDDLERMILGNNNAKSSASPSNNLPDWALPQRLRGQTRVTPALTESLDQMSDNDLEKMLTQSTSATETQQPQSETPIPDGIKPPLDETKRNEKKQRKLLREQVDQSMMSAVPLAGPIMWLMGQGRFDDEDKGWQSFKNNGRRTQELITGKERDSWGDLGGQSGVGWLRGMADVRDTLEQGVGSGVNYIASKIAPQGIADAINKKVTEDAEDFQASRDAFNRIYGDRTAASFGRTAGQITGTAPAWAYGPVAAIAARAGAAVPTMIGSRIVTGAVGGALGGGIMNAGTSAASDKPFLEHVAEGAKGGAIAGGTLSAIGAAAKLAANKLLGPPDVATKKLAERAEELGVKLRGAQVSPSYALKKWDQISGQLPGSGGAKIAIKQQAQFNRAVAKTFGEEADAITPEVLERARERLGGDFERIGKASTVKVDQQMAGDFQKLITEARDHLTDSEFKVVAAKINDIVKMAGGTSKLTGEQYQALVRKDTPLWRATKSPDPNIRYYANQIRESLDSALERSVAPELRAELREARRQWKAMKTVEGLADKGVGDVSPQLLMGKVMQSPGGKKGSGELGELADIGKRFLKEPRDSGTPQGTFMANMISHPVSTIGAVSAGMAAKLPYMTELGGGLAVNRLLREAILNRDYFKRIILNQRSGQGGAVGAIANKLVPVIGAQINSSDR